MRFIGAGIVRPHTAGPLDIGAGIPYRPPAPEMIVIPTWSAAAIYFEVSGESRTSPVHPGHV